MTAPQPILAAGGVVFRKRKERPPEYLVIHRPRYDDWSLPKGKLDPGESYEQCALREVEEETGRVAKLREQIGTVAYETSARNMKRVRYWVMEAISGSFEPNGEVDEVAWLRPRKARSRLSYSRDRAVFDRGVQLVKRPASGRIYLLRHARAGDARQWKGPDRKRPLSKRGRVQAAALTDALSSMPLTRLFSSKATRCIETITPLSELLGLDVERHRALAEGNETTKGFFDLVGSLRGATAAMSTHGDVVEEVIGRLVRKGVSIDGPLKWRTGSIWVLETRKGKVTKARYLPPAA